MTDLNIDGILNACDAVQRRTIYAEGYMHSCVRCFDACMRAFTGKPAAEAVTYKIYLNAPIMKPGEVTIHRNGEFQMYTV